MIEWKEEQGDRLVAAWTLLIDLGWFMIIVERVKYRMHEHEIHPLHQLLSAQL
jgi:hypothetical protein